MAATISLNSTICARMASGNPSGVIDATASPLFANPLHSPESVPSSEATATVAR
jgi:hypothetical protein